MKLTITHADVKVEYEDNRKSANSYEMIEAINALGKLVELIKDQIHEEEEKNGGTGAV